MDVLEFYVMIQRGSQPPMWLSDDETTLTEDFGEASGFIEESTARAIADRETRKGDIQYVFALLGS